MLSAKSGQNMPAIACETEKYLEQFAESCELSEESSQKVEEYFVRVWTGAGRRTSSQTFDQVRLESHTKGATPKSLAQLQPTSSVIQTHIQQ